MPSTLEELAEEIRELPPARRSALEPAVITLVAALMAESEQTLRELLSGEPSPIDLRNLARLELLSAQVQDAAVPGRDLTRETGLSRQRLQQLRDSGRLLGLQPPLRREYWYPRWQFQEDWSVKKLVPRLLSAAAEARLSPLGLHLTMTNPAAGIGGLALVDLLDDHPEEVLEVVSGAGDIGS